MLGLAALVGPLGLLWAGGLGLAEVGGQVGHPIPASVHANMVEGEHNYSAHQPLLFEQNFSSFSAIY